MLLPDSTPFRSRLCLIVALATLALTGQGQPSEPSPPDRPGPVDRIEDRQRDRDRPDRESPEAREARPDQGRPAQPRREPRALTPADVERRELRQQLEALRTEFRELEAAGKPDEAVAVERRIDRLEARLADLNRNRPSRPARERDQRPPSPAPPEIAELRRRLEHVRVAVEHLRAAGWQEAAERLVRQADELRRAAEPRDSWHPARGRERATDDDLRAAVEDLRNDLRETRERLERLERERR